MSSYKVVCSWGMNENDHIKNLEEVVKKNVRTGMVL